MTTIEPKAQYAKLSVIVPTYNERNTIAEVVRRMRAVELPLDREIIVVDDGSTDGTRDVLKQLDDSTLRVVQHPANRGKGAAIRTGLELVTGDLVLIQDADLEYDPDDWPKLLGPVLKRRAVVVYGSRFTGERRNMLFWHWVANRMLSLVANVLYNSTLSDMETGHKLFDKRVLDRIRLRARSFDFEPEVTAKVLKSGIHIYEVPISYAGRTLEEGKKITWEDGVVALWTLLKYRVSSTEVTAPSCFAAVVVNYEAGPLLVPCVESLLADTSAGPPEVVVVDNRSRDGSVDALRERHLDVAILDAGANLGYSAAANLGIAATRGSVVAVCNPDLRVEPGTAAVLVGRLDAEPDLGAVGPRILEPDGAVYPSARRVPSTLDAVGHGTFGRIWPTNPFTRRYRELDADPGVARDVDWVSGAAVWLRRAALEQVGGWDERYFMYVEDVDLCWSLRRAGWRVAYEPGGTVVHVQGVSTDRHPYRMIVAHHRSLLRYAEKRWTGWRRVLLVPAALYLAARTGAECLVQALGRRPGRAD